MPAWRNYFDEMTKMRWCTVIFIFLLYGLNQAVAKEWGTLFRWQTDEGIRWMLVGIVSVHDRYEGQYQNGLPEGQVTNYSEEEQVNAITYETQQLIESLHRLEPDIDENETQ